MFDKNLEGDTFTPVSNVWNRLCIYSREGGGGGQGKMRHFLHLMILLQNRSVFVSNNSYYEYLRLLCTHGN